MSDLPTSVEQPHIDLQEKIETSIPRFEAPAQNEALHEAENQPPTEKQVEVALPPELQPDPVVASPTEVVSATPSTYINKGKTTSSLTDRAIADFQNLQHKLVVHYQRLKSEGGAG